MNKEALGLIETYGYVAAIEAADASLKAANVNLKKCEFIKGGLVTILITGDVSAVKASVDAGEAAASRVGKVISTTVIARTGEGLDEVFYKDEDKVEDKIIAEESFEKIEKEEPKKEEFKEKKTEDRKSQDSKKKL
ncbi:BMC domain-containing protein [Anaerosalibacter bizertensis]|uniref:BMC domain-containing protein n=1 Tax=Anaerosalibacter bizertensis TaxID=932217 RepID=A0A844FK76_9FIRM|nr:BMC domain-containing protein [Anaerosalibacter bizertensis]